VEEEAAAVVGSKRRRQQRGRRPTPGRTHSLGGPIDIADIVVAAVCAVTDGIAATSATANDIATATTIPESISLLILIHFWFLYRVATDAEIPAIWMEVHVVSSNQSGLSLLVQQLMSGMGI